MKIPDISAATKVALFAYDYVPSKKQFAAVKALNEIVYEVRMAERERCAEIARRWQGKWSVIATEIMETSK